MLIEVNNLSVAYDQKEVVHSVDFNIKKGEVITIVGPNGCGKSTVLKSIARLLKPTQGEIKLDSQNIKQLKTKDIAKKMAILPQIRKTPDDFDVETLIRYGRYPHGNFRGKLSKEDQDIIDWAIKKTGMSHHRKKHLNQLSGGERQRAWIAMALAQKTEIIILDEPTTFLDLSHQLEVLELVRDLNKKENVTILMVLHDLNQAIRYSDRVYVMERGKVIASGAPNEIINSELLKATFRIDSDFLYDERHKCNHFIPFQIKGEERVKGCPAKRKT